VVGAPVDLRKRVEEASAQPTAMSASVKWMPAVGLVGQAAAHGLQRGGDTNHLAVDQAWGCAGHRCGLPDHFMRARIMSSRPSASAQVHLDALAA
jgi:hypothetical protein